MEESITVTTVTVLSVVDKRGTALAEQHMFTCSCVILYQRYSQRQARVP